MLLLTADEGIDEGTKRQRERLLRALSRLDRFLESLVCPEPGIVPATGQAVDERLVDEDERERRLVPVVERVPVCALQVRPRVVDRVVPEAEDRSVVLEVADELRSVERHLPIAQSEVESIRPQRLPLERLDMRSDRACVGNPRGARGVSDLGHLVRARRRLVEVDPHEEQRRCQRQRSVSAHDRGCVR